MNKLNKVLGPVLVGAITYLLLVAVILAIGPMGYSPISLPVAAAPIRAAQVSTFPTATPGYFGVP